MRIRFISDVHMGTTDWKKLDHLVRAMQGPSEVVFVGDVFDYWVGARHIEAPTYRALSETLARLTRGGLPISFVRGNRDFMIDYRFAQKTGVKLVGPWVERELGGKRVHVEHGDLLFDKNPLAYRRLARRFGILAAGVRNSPFWLVDWLGRGMRQASRYTTARILWSPEDILDRTRAAFRAGCDVFILGHIHQPQVIVRNLYGRERMLIVLGNWDEEGKALFCDWDGAKFELASAAP